ncbi:MAG: 50S ribosomal protein L21 [Candidatus Doudnabacteria bacterium]|nr:50S ribosomal protein L21 [Candidatus Doudnabacteria bacterium]
MFAIIETGGKQYLVQKGDRLQIEKLVSDAGSTITFDKLLLTSDEKDFTLGKPYIQGATVEGKVLKQGRGRKIRVFKYKAKSKYRRTIGHRQHFTEIEITKI